MIRTIQPTNLPSLLCGCPLIDVRSPGEFDQGHIPGAVNIPLFSDAERAVIGTLFVRAGQPQAILKGLDIALPKVEDYLRKIKEVLPAGVMLLHCWRGGLRSALMAEVFSKAGYEVALLEGGYKAYRHYIRAELAKPAKIIVLGGYTGSGKTEILHAIALKGEQVIDLEGLACHKGSVFGAIGQPPQPTNEQFENNLYDLWEKLDFSRPVWLEDESRMIGRVTLPDPVVEHLSNGLLIRTEMEREYRIGRLVRDYALFDKQLLEDAIRKIGERLGGARTAAALTALDNGRFGEVASIVLAWYDKAYLFAMARRKNKTLFDIPVSGTDPEQDADLIIKCASNFF